MEYETRESIKKEMSKFPTRELLLEMAVDLKMMKVHRKGYDFDKELKDLEDEIERRSE